MSDWNAQIVEEFRSNGGQVGDMFEGWTLLLLHTTGAKSGQQRLSPLVYQAVGDSYAIFASKAGAPSHPDWYHNLVANPKVKIEVGTGTIDGIARVAQGEERERIWSKQKADRPNFAEYEANTDREIPVVVVDPA